MEFACSICGKTVRPGDDFQSCPDCGAIFCADCLDELESHECEDCD